MLATADDLIAAVIDYAQATADAYENAMLAVRHPELQPNADWARVQARRHHATLLDRIAAYEGATGVLVRDRILQGAVRQVDLLIESANARMRRAAHARPAA